jgi:DNA-directed RNA polymerase subunit RPC12/RpoP
MRNFKIREANLSSKIMCSFFGHKIITTRNVTDYFREYKCSTCGLELTNDTHGHKIFLTPKLKDINESLINLYNRRHLSV